MRLELEQEIDDVDEEENDASAAADFQRHEVGRFVIVEGCAKGGGKHEADDTQTEQASTHLGDGAVVDLH